MRLLFTLGGLVLGACAHWSLGFLVLAFTYAYPIADSPPPADIDPSPIHPLPGPAPSADEPIPWSDWEPPLVASPVLATTVNDDEMTDLELPPPALPSRVTRRHVRFRL